MYQTTNTSDVSSKPPMDEYNFAFQLLLNKAAIVVGNLKSKDIQALTAAINELTYGLNTIVMSSLAITEDEHQHVHDIVMTRYEVNKEG
jgi:hypothetical protein